MRRLTAAICLVLAGWSGTGLTAHGVLAAALCVGNGPGCYATVQAALNAAHDGDVIRIGPGTFAGGIAVTASVQIVGAGAGATIISGGGPVVTIGTPNAAAEPTVSLTGVTVTGGINHAVPSPSDAEGGGIYVAPAAQGSAPTTVTILNSVITGNRAQALAGDGQTPSSSTSRGGGIANFGTMTLVNTMVRANTAAWSDITPEPNFDKAEGGGITNNLGATMTLRNCTVSGNAATLVATQTVTGDGAASGGILNQGIPAQPATLIVENSSITGNTVANTTTLATNFAYAFGGGIGSISSLTVRNSVVQANAVRFTTAVVQPNMGASGGGIEVARGTAMVDGSTIAGNTLAVTSTSRDPNSGVGGSGGGVYNDGQMTIRDSQVAGNSLTATAYGGFAGASGGGIEDDGSGSLLLLGSTVRDNHASSALTSAQTAAGALAAGGGMDVVGSVSINGATFSANSVTATSPAASAAATAPFPTGTLALGGALNVEGGNTPASTVTMTDSLVLGNRTAATTTSGTADGPGGGIANSGKLSLRNTAVLGNTSSAGGPSGFAGGGGIWNDLPGGPAPSLSLINSTIRHNSAVGSSAGITVQGGGLFNGTSDGATAAASGSVIAQNTPGSCYPLGVVQGCIG